MADTRTCKQWARGIATQIVNVSLDLMGGRVDCWGDSNRPNKGTCTMAKLSRIPTPKLSPVMVAAVKWLDRADAGKVECSFCGGATLECALAAVQHYPMCGA